ncbi:MAG: histidine kinase, partial [Phycisphaerales bacterium]|nr:histidine kinase [Phycisphaerales bacterium]
NGVFTHYGVTNGLLHEDVRGFHEDRQRVLWIATYGGGVCRLENGVIRGVPGLTAGKAWTFHEDPDGVMWIATDTGLVRYDKGKTFLFTRKHGLFDDRVNRVMEDEAGMLWLSCNRGIFRVSRHDLNAVAGGRLAAANYVAYGEADGMISSETNGEYQPSGCRLPDGSMWFPTQRGVVAINPKTVYRNELPPPVIVEQVTIDDEVVIGGAPAMEPGDTNSVRLANEIIKLPAGRARVMEVRYTANSFVEPSKVRFKHWLVGHDSDWRDAGASRVAYFHNLRPGSYRFRVKACNNHGYWNETGAEFQFYLAPHFYQTWPFFVLCGAVVILTAAGVQAYRLRVQRRIMQAEQQAAVQRERARIAQDMHDDLGAYLTKIAILSETTQNRAADEPCVKNNASTIS